MMHSVSTRMLLAVGVVVTAAVVAVGFVVQSATRSGFQQFLDMEAETIRSVYPRQPADPARQEVETAVVRVRKPGPEPLAWEDSMRAWVPPEGHRVLLMALTGDTTFGPGGDSLHTQVRQHGVWMARGRFLTSVDRWVVGAVAGAGVLALVATAGIARRLLGPVRDLTAAARRLAGGDLDARVAVRTKDEIGELAAAFNAMASSLARGEQLRRQMVTDVAHELRTPLTNLRGQLEAMEDGLLQPTPEVLESLREETRHLSRLVEDLQELSLAEAGRLRFDRSVFALEPELHKTAARLRPAHGGPSIEVAAAGLPPVFADPERVRQILRNLVENAVRHTPEDGTIRVEAAAVPGFVRVEVADSGSGIAPEHLGHVFERFYRGDASRARATGGAGLGLAIVKELVEAQGGEVWVRSEPGRGACFGFSLPTNEESRP